MQTRHFWFHHRVYPLWGPLALWWNIRLYGHRFDGDNWTSRLWKKTRRGKRKEAERAEKLAKYSRGCNSTAE